MLSNTTTLFTKQMRSIIIEQCHFLSSLSVFLRSIFLANVFVFGTGVVEEGNLAERQNYE